jgi:PAS domain S-box-containing protein
MTLPETEIEVRRALAEDEFFPVFQPFVELRSGRLVGFEVLARWKHPILGTVSPNDFVPIVEHCGLIDEMILVLFRKALTCEDLKQSLLGLSINVSQLQLLHFDSLEKVSAASERSGFQLKRLTIEITETVIVDDLERATAVAQQLKTLGCRLALDDFGTGYSSLKHLQALPFDELKVDQSFVRSMTQRRESRKIVGAAVGLGQALGLTTIAEGVETEEQANMLFWMGCDVGQGWFFGRPVGIEDLPHLIQRGQHDSFRLASPRMHNVQLFNGEALPTQRLAQLQALFDSAPVGLCLLDRGLHYTNVNAMLAEMNGAPIEAHLGRSVGELTPDFFPLAEPFLRAALGGEPVSGVEPLKRPSGGGPIRSVLASCQPVRDEAGEVLGISAAVLDVSKCRQVEEALRETEEHFRAVMQLHPHVPWVMNTAGEIIEGSQKWEDITGQKKDDALGDGWLRMLHPDDVQPALDGIRESLRTAAPLRIQFRVKTLGGDWCRMVSRGSARIGPSGNVVCLYGVMEPDGELGHQPEELRLRCEQLSAAIEAIPIGIVLAGALDGTIFLVNSIARGWFDNRLCIGQKVSEFSRTPLAGADGQPLDVSRFPLACSLLRGEPVQDMEVLYARQEGAQLHLVLSSKPIYSSEGRLVGAIMLVQEPGTAAVVRKSRLLCEPAKN